MRKRKAMRIKLPGAAFEERAKKSGKPTSRRSTAYPCSLPCLGEFGGSWPCRFAVAKVAEFYFSTNENAKNFCYKYRISGRQVFLIEGCAAHPTRYSDHIQEHTACCKVWLPQQMAPAPTPCCRNCRRRLHWNQTPVLRHRASCCKPYG